MEIRKILIHSIKGKVELIHEDVEKISMEETDLELLDKFNEALSSSMLALAKVIMDEKLLCLEPYMGSYFFAKLSLLIMN